MRKYYKTELARKRGLNQKLDHTVSPWFILGLFVREAAGCFPWDILCGLISSIENESVASYLRIVQVLDNCIQKEAVDLGLTRVAAYRQAASLLKKYPFVISDLETETRIVALEKLRECEEQCRATNARLRSLQTLPRWFHRARNICYDILGELTPDLVMKIINQGRHGPGSTLTSQGNRVSAHYKFADLPYSVTKEARPYAYAAISSDPKWIDYLESTGRRKELPPFGSRVQRELMLFDECVNVENSDKITFVPKDCKTDRPIAVGASLNIFLQLGVKAYMEERLKLFGVDLTSQEKNRRFAREGSTYAFLQTGEVNPNQFSTLDLASASDTISCSLVELLLPTEWFAFLDDLRHKTGIIDGQLITYEKFCAMGNGFTFPLESLIFFCICKAAVEDSGFSCTTSDISIFGDDIIVRYKTTPSVIPALEWAGFSVNPEKSFLSGVFKESCGEDYYSGTNVRPIYLKREVSNYGDAYYVFNRCSNANVRADFRTYLGPMAVGVIAQIPREHLVFGPMADDGSVSESYVSTPFSYLSSSGLRPWLTDKERLSLLRAGIMKADDVKSQLPFYFTSFASARTYRANQRVNYMIALRDKFEENPFQGNSVDLSEIDSRYTNRRNSVQYVIRVIPVPNWNGSYSRHQLYRSLVWSLQVNTARSVSTDRKLAKPLGPTKHSKN